VETDRLWLGPISQRNHLAVSREGGSFLESRGGSLPASAKAIPPTFIHQLSRSRCRIDTEVFQTLTIDCNLKHPAVHQSTALVVLTMIRALAYMLSLIFYHRQVRSHTRGPCTNFHEFAKRLAYGFVALSPDTS
jgi:hypothetical protein